MQPAPRSGLPRQIREANVPMLHLGVPRLIRSLSNDNIGLNEITAIVERFPSVALRLIALANSVWSSPVSPVQSLHMACSRLGLNVVRSVSIALAVASPFEPKRCPGFDVGRYWSSALLTADTAYALATGQPKHADLDPQAVRAAGLLHNIGLIWMASQISSEMAAVLKCKALTPDASLSDLMRASLGWDYAEAGAHIGALWKLPDIIVLSMQRHTDDYQGNAWQTVHLVRRARNMVSVIANGEQGERQLAKLASLRASATGSSTDEQMEQVRARFASTQALVQQLFVG